MVMYDKYINGKFTLEEIDNNILTEYARQRMFLERKVRNLMKRDAINTIFHFTSNFNQNLFY